MRHFVDKTVNAVAQLIEASILHEYQRNEIRCPRQRHPMLLDIGGILGGIELDLHTSRVDKRASILKGLCIYEFWIGKPGRGEGDGFISEE